MFINSANAGCIPALCEAHSWDPFLLSRGPMRHARHSLSLVQSLISSVSAQKTSLPSAALPPKRFCAYHEAYMLSYTLIDVQLIQVTVLKPQFSLRA